MNTLDTFTHYRSLLFSIAYRMLGSVAEAEDMVQETYLRWQRTLGDGVQNPKAYLASITTRLCIDHFRSARVQRETYIGPWLPEPVMEDTPADHAALAESLSIAFLKLLETLTPLERAVFLLREVFDYEYSEIAQMVETSEANCRQMVSRARGKVRTGRPRFKPSAEEQERLISEFMQACVTGDLKALLNLFAEDITAWSDGGGKATAARKPVYGAEQVARFMLGLMKTLPRALIPQFVTLNGQRSLVLYHPNGQPYDVMWFDLADGRIHGLYSILNPDKLRGIPPLN
ncbi:MAG: RNA polymerase sigma-70 factor [Anaerolineales bacterium]